MSIKMNRVKLLGTSILYNDDEEAMETIENQINAFGAEHKILNVSISLARIGDLYDGLYAAVTYEE